MVVPHWSRPFSIWRNKPARKSGTGARRFRLGAGPAPALASERRPLPVKNKKRKTGDKRLLSGISRTLDITLQWVLIVLMVSLTAIVIIAVIYRKFDASLSWYDEVASITLAWITYYGAALAALRRQHIGFDSVILAVPVGLRVIAVFIAEVLVIAFFLLLAWAGFEVLDVLEGETLVSLTWLPIQFTQSVIPIGAILFIVAELLSAPAYLKSVMSGISSEHPELDIEAAGGGSRP
jgi:TRAP-type C4-dicarboxylate transport system permease small subunit